MQARILRIAYAKLRTPKVVTRVKSRYQSVIRASPKPPGPVRLNGPRGTHPTSHEWYSSHFSASRREMDRGVLIPLLTSGTLPTPRSRDARLGAPYDSASRGVQLLVVNWARFTSTQHPGPQHLRRGNEAGAHRGRKDKCIRAILPNIAFGRASIQNPAFAVTMIQRRRTSILAGVNGLHRIFAVAKMEEAGKLEDGRLIERKLVKVKERSESRSQGRKLTWDSHPDFA